ncbi:MAG TPA: nucleoside deaminase [Thermoanaerobaculia bacterium]|nr:nucleoside deaminase [Thermoanaerobaculia bacterium]
MATSREELMRRAIDLAVDNVRRRMGGPFAALVVRQGRVIAEGTNRVTTENDPTAHAEIVAVRTACQTLGTFDLAGCEVYASCEPCPMCLGALYWARIDRLWFAADREAAAAAGFDDALIYREVPLPPEQRVLPTSRLSTGVAGAPFTAWAELADRVEY